MKTACLASLVGVLLFYAGCDTASRGWARSSDSWPEGAREKRADPGVASNSDSPWKIPVNWDKVRDGMSERQVIAILGWPTSTDNLGPLRTLYYRGEVRHSGFVSGNIKLTDDRVYLVNKPVFDMPVRPG